MSKGAEFEPPNGGPAVGWGTDGTSSPFAKKASFKAGLAVRFPKKSFKVGAWNKGRGETRHAGLPLERRSGSILDGLSSQGIKATDGVEEEEIGGSFDTPPVALNTEANGAGRTEDGSKAGEGAASSTRSPEAAGEDAAEDLVPGLTSFPLPPKISAEGEEASPLPLESASEGGAEDGSRPSEDASGITTVPPMTPLKGTTGIAGPESTVAGGPTKALESFSKGNFGDASSSTTVPLMIPLKGTLDSGLFRQRRGPQRLCLQACR